jgi:hypothetical protein
MLASDVLAWVKDSMFVVLLCSLGGVLDAWGCCRKAVGGAERLTSGGNLWGLAQRR